METLQLKHLAPYLPYELPIYAKDCYPLVKFKMHAVGGTGFIGINNVITSNMYKPILRPMSDLHNTYLAWREIASSVAQSNNDEYVILKDFTKTEIITAHFYLWLISNHFDVFGLIEKGLAIDINSLKQTKP